MPGRSFSSARPKPAYAFRPTSGTFVGGAGLVVVGAVLVLVALNERNLTGVRIALVATAVGVLIWMVLLRPRVTAYAETLLLRNMAGDTHLPLAGIDMVAVRHTLNVWVGERRFTCPGIGRSSRAMMREKRHGSDATGGADYATFVESTIEELARAARRDLRGDPPPVRHRWAFPELAALSLLVVALVLTFL